MARTRSSNPIVKFLSQQRGELSKLLILTHDHPDPDAMASAWGLAALAKHHAGTRCRIAYGGVIGRMENQLLVRILKVPIQPLRPYDLERASHVALVDTQPPFQNNRFPSRRRATIVIDHHPRHARTQTDFAMIDETAGATTTLLIEAMLAGGVPIPPRMATALVYGIGSETQHLLREAGPRDIAAYRAVLPKATVQSLSKIQNPRRPSIFFCTLGKAIQQAFVVKQVIGVHLGEVPSQDVVPHMADFLLTHEAMRWSIVTGRYDGRLFVSLRTDSPRAEAGRLLWRLLGSGTSAGGHGMIAGGSVLVGRDAGERAWEAAERRVMKAFLCSQRYKEPFNMTHPYQHTPANVRGGR